MYPRPQKCFNSRFKVPELLKKKGQSSRLMGYTNKEPAETGEGVVNYWLDHFLKVSGVFKYQTRLLCIQRRASWRCSGLLGFFRRAKCTHAPTLFLYFNDGHKIPNVKTSESPSKRRICTGGFPPIASSHCTSLPHSTTAVWLFQNLAKVHTRARRARDW